MVLNKEKYRLLCDENKDIPLFMQAWWLDAVCEPENKIWDVFINLHNGKIIGAMPYHLLKKFRLKGIIQPRLSQYNGIWLNYPENQSTYKRLSFEKKIYSYFIEEISKADISYYQQNFHHSVKNWLPFYWNGYSQTTRYTYVINDISDSEIVFNNFSYAKQKQIRKANKVLDISFDLSYEDFYIHQTNSLLQKGKKNLLSKELVLNCCKKAFDRNQGLIVSASDSDGNIHAAVFVVYDANSAYNLISTIDSRYSDSGASTLIIWEAIKHLSNKTKSFDFEGSMTESIENSFSQFGTTQVPYFCISKINSEIFTKFKNIWKL